MGFKKNNPGCNCCAGCNICQDDFTRADDTNISTGSPCSWTESSGSWDISSNALRCTSAGTVICDTPDTGTCLAQSVTVQATHSTSGSSIDLILNRYDSSNYVYARFTFGSNTFELHHVVAGADTSLSSGSVTLNTGSTYGLVICSDGAGHVKVSVDATTSISTDAATIHASATKSGLTANGSGTATIDSFLFAHSYNASEFPDCTECFACSVCTTAPPKQIRLVASGIADNACTGCVAIVNGTFDLDLICDCFYWYQFPTPVTVGCASNIIGWLVYLQSTGANMRIDAFLKTAASSLICTATPSHNANWNRTGVAKNSCLTWSSLSLPNTSFFGGGCGYTPGVALVNVTSIP